MLHNKWFSLFSCFILNFARLNWSILPLCNAMSHFRVYASKGVKKRGERGEGKRKEKEKNPEEAKERV